VQRFTRLLIVNHEKKRKVLTEFPVDLVERLHAPCSADEMDVVFVDQEKKRDRSGKIFESYLSIGTTAESVRVGIKDTK
jgi:hypothetical protein